MSPQLHISNTDALRPPGLISGELLQQIPEIILVPKEKKYFNSEFRGFPSSADGHAVLKPWLRKGGSSPSRREHRQVTAFQLEAGGWG